MKNLLYWLVKVAVVVGLIAWAINARNEETFRNYGELSAKIHGLRCEVDRLNKKVAKDCRADWEND